MSKWTFEAGSCHLHGAKKGGTVESENAPRTPRDESCHESSIDLPGWSNRIRLVLREDEDLWTRRKVEDLIAKRKRKKARHTVGY
jgi:hypothetical protein